MKELQVCQESDVLMGLKDVFEAIRALLDDA